MNKDLIYIFHIKDAADHILEYTKNGKNEFLTNSLVQDAAIRNFQIIGEASKKISQTTLIKHDNIPWSKMAKFRDKIIHDSFGINYELVWDIVEIELPKIISAIEFMIQNSKDSYFVEIYQMF
jgi:uncharacterized protein with HEPN domain